MVMTCYCCGTTQEMSHLQSILEGRDWIRYPNLTFVMGKDVCTCPSCSQRVNGKLLKILNEVKKEIEHELVIDSVIVSEEVIEENVLSEM